MAGGLFGGGDGTELTPYLVEDAHDLNAVRNNLSAHYKQVGDIDLDISPYNTGNGWSRIGTGTNESTNMFRGFYDGDNFIIRNLYINDSLSSYCSLFGTVYTPTLRNIHLENVLITACGNDSGSLFGYTTLLNDGSIYNCSATGIVNDSNTQSSYIGGLIGRISNSTKKIGVEKCYFNGIVKGKDGIGGFIGHSWRNGIEKSYSVGEVIASGYDIGGFCGSCGGSISISRSEFSFCYSLCNVTTSSTVTDSDVGGFIGDIGQYTIISKCFARGNVTSSGGYVGGFVGKTNRSSSNPVCNQCYSTGRVIGIGSTVGGFVGQILGTISGCVWDIETSEMSTSLDGIGKTTLEMKTQSTYTDIGWTFV
jgi:hypothetical protein